MWFPKLYCNSQVVGMLDMTKKWDQEKQWERVQVLETTGYVTLPETNIAPENGWLELEY